MKLFKKEEGNMVENFGITGLLLIVCAILLIASINGNSTTHNKNQIDLIQRQYLLRMESQGCLTNSDKANLISDLENIGVKNITVDSSCSNKVKYGDYITLKFTADIPIKVLKSEKLNLQNTVEYVNKTCSMTSTAKY